LLIISLVSLFAKKLLFVLIQKVTKKIKSAGMLLCAHGLCPAKRAEPGLQYFAPCFARTFPCASAKFAMPCLHSRPPSFCPFSAEASRLPDGKKKNALLHQTKNPGHSTRIYNIYLYPL
jgi:hypothetical protein